MACLYTKPGHVYATICCLGCMVTVVSAQNDGINWPTVALAWVLSLITTFVVVAVTLVVLRALKRRRKRRNQPPKITRELSVFSDASHFTSVSEQSTNPLVKSNGAAPGYKRATSRESTVNRRKSDFVSQWCSRYGLSEVIAANLRDNGFNSQKQLESLQTSDVMTLGLPNVAQQVQLRGVIESVRRKREMSPDDVDGKPEVQAPLLDKSQRTSSSSAGSRTRSVTVEETPILQTPSPKQPSVLPAHGQLSFPSNHGNSERQYGIMTSQGGAGHVTSAGSHMMPSQTHHVTEELPYDMHVSHASSHSHHPFYLARNRHPPRHTFHGLLSDSGLYDLAESLGSEWLHLTAILGVPKAQLDHIQNDFPNNTKQQIHEMLRLWRDSAKGEKEEIKAKLNEGFKKIKRKDLADLVLREQVHGSDEKLTQRGRTSHSVV